MLEDQVAYLLQRYLGNYVKGLNKEALKISVWKGDVELTNMQLKPEALNALKLPVKVKAGFLGSVKLKVPWSRLGQEPVLVYLDRIFVLAEPETQVEGCNEDAVQEAKKNRVREMEMKLLEKNQQLKSAMSQSWLGSLINTIIGNLKLSISNIHIRYEDLESNPGHPFAAGVTLEKLIAVTVDDNGKETFVTGGALERMQKSVELEQLAFYLDSDISPWHLYKSWEDLLPSEWVQVFRFGTNNGEPADQLITKHAYVLQPVTGNAKYIKFPPNEHAQSNQPLQKAAVNLDDVTLCLSKGGYRDILKLADNFAAFNQRLKYAHYRPLVSVESNPSSWWKYAYRAISDQMKKVSGKMSWEQVLKYAKLRKRYISLYASLLKSDTSRAIVDDNEEIEKIDRELDIELILQWRMLAHKFMEQSAESDLNWRKQKEKKSWWSFGWSKQSIKDETEPFHFTDEDWEQLNRIIGYKEGDDRQMMVTTEKKDALQTSLEIHMNHNASKLMDDSQEYLAALSCEDLDCFIKLYPETKVIDVRLGSYHLSSPDGLLAESATSRESLVGIFCYKPFDAEVDWSMVAKASPCYMTYLKDTIDHVVKFFENNADVGQKIALETAAAVQMTIDEVKRTAQQQMQRALKDHSRFIIDLDIAAPKITIPTDFQPDNAHSTKLLLDLGNLRIHTADDQEDRSTEELQMYMQFDVVLSDVSAFLVDGDYSWGQKSLKRSSASAYLDGGSFMPVLDKCGVILRIQQIRLEDPSYPSTRLAMRLPSLGFHFSPARYHRLMQVVKIFQGEEDRSSNLCAWSQADLEGWFSILVRKGVGNREAIWQRRYLCLVGPFLYVLESPNSKSYKQCISLRGKQVYRVPPDSINVENVLALGGPARSNRKIVEDINAMIIRCDTEELRELWQKLLQAAIYRASGSAPLTSLSESSDVEESEEGDQAAVSTFNLEKLFMTGVLNELKICFYYNDQHGQNFMRVLLANESQLFEFRAIGGQVELLMRGNDLFIGTLLKSLEIEDLVLYGSVTKPRYLARSFIRSADEFCSSNDAKIRNFDGEERTSEGDDQFYEASDKLIDSDSLLQSSPNLHSSSEYSPMSWNFLEPPSFNRNTGLLPVPASQTKEEPIELTDTLDSFVKAQIVVHDQNSSLYGNIDKRVTVTLATLSFFCRRPTILAIMEFVNAINTEDESCESFSDSSSAIVKSGLSREDVADGVHSVTAEEPVVKSLLGKGKTRIVFKLTLKMARAQILLMKENEAKLATLSQDNLLADIKVFPSSFCIKAALGNLRMSDDSLPSNHMYFWICDMRNPGGSSFVELLFSSFNADDEDYEGYEYGLFGQLSEVRIVYLNRFVQEIVSYFMGLVPKDSKDVVKLKDQVTESEKWFTTSEIEGSPAMKLDLSLRKPIILMPRQTDSLDYLKLDIVHITVQNTFQWFFGSKKDINAVHLETMTILVEDINLNVGSGSELGESIIQDVKGVSIIIKRSLRDLLHQIPSLEAAVKMEELKAILSSKEYQIITECAQANFSEKPNLAPSLTNSAESSFDTVEPLEIRGPEIDSSGPTRESRITTTVSVVIDLIELSLHSGAMGDASLANVQVSGSWFLYKSNTLGDGFLSASLNGFTVIDNREGTEEEYRLAIGKSEDIANNSVPVVFGAGRWSLNGIDVVEDDKMKMASTMLILDAKFTQSSTFVSLSVQRPQLLVALDFLLAVIEFFVPTVGNILTSEDIKEPKHISDVMILDQSIYQQPSEEASLCPQRPLIVDDERYDHFIYDGQGGKLYLKDRQGCILCAPSRESMIYVGNGKKLQFKNVTIRDGRYLDSCITLGTDSSYSASEEDNVFFEELDEAWCRKFSAEEVSHPSSPNAAVRRSSVFIVELQAVGPELTFYNTSKDVGESESLILSNKLLHAQLDVFCRLVMKDDAMEINANALGLTMESNGIRILEPFDTNLRYSNASGKTNIHFSVSDIFMNLSFSILRLFLAVEDDILAFMRMTSRKMTVLCTQFDKVGTIRDVQHDQVCVFWRPRAPPGFAVLGDYLTPTEKPPTKGVLAVNTNFSRVKKPLSFKAVWPPLAAGDGSEICIDTHGAFSGSISGNDDTTCSVWLPVAPRGYVALGCVVSRGREQPSQSSVFCILASLVTSCSLQDCVAISSDNMHPSTLAFWRVANSVGTFLPADPAFCLVGRPYELCHLMFGNFYSPKVYESSYAQASSNTDALRSQREALIGSGRRFEAVARFQLVWWNQGSSSRKKLSIWRPIVPQGVVYFGDLAVQGYEPPNTCIVMRDTGVEELFKDPLDFQLVGQVKKQKGMESISFWMPQAAPGFVSLGCVACKSYPKQQDFSALKCIRSDMVSGDQFFEDSLWDTANVKVGEPFSIWAVDNDLGTFIIRSGFKKPPRRYALKLADLNTSSSSDDMVIDAEIRTFSAALFDDYGGLMVPLFNIALSGMGFTLHGRAGYTNSTVSFSLTARSYNDKYESWEPVVEPIDGFFRYQYDLNSPGAVSQLRLTSTRDLNLNVSVSNANMILQAYASWSNLNHVHKSNKKRVFPSTLGGGSLAGVHHKKDYYIIPRNKLGQDIFIRATEISGLSNIIKMESGDMKPLKVPVLKNMLASHLEGKLATRYRAMVTVIIADAQFPAAEALSSHEYVVAIRILQDPRLPSDSMLHHQSARTRGSKSDNSSFGHETVNWREMFFFKVDSPDSYIVELIVTDMAKGDAIGFFSAPLKQIAESISENLNSFEFLKKLSWIDLLPPQSTKINGEGSSKSCGKLKCSVLLSARSEFETRELTSVACKKSGFIQISPTMEGPWTTVRLNYAAPAACWRLGNDVVASEVSVQDGHRYVDIRALVSVRNETDYILELRLKTRASDGRIATGGNASGGLKIESNKIEITEFFETQKYDPSIGWVNCSASSKQEGSGGSPHKGNAADKLPLGWEWMDDWHLDVASVNTGDGWIYAPDIESLKWPESYDPTKPVNHARQRRWIRNKKQISGFLEQEISVGQLRSGESTPLPLMGLLQSRQYRLELRPIDMSDSHEYSWSSGREKLGTDGKAKGIAEVCVSSLVESDELFFCNQLSGSSSNSLHKLLFRVSIQPVEVGKDIHCNPIHDWSIVVKAPLSLVNFLPLAAEFTIFESQADSRFFACMRGILCPGKPVNVYNADITNPLYLSLLPQRGWLPVHEAVLISHPHGLPSKTMIFRSAITGRIVQIILEQNHDKEHPLLARIIRVYAPYWFAVARCPPLTYKFIEVEGKKYTKKFSLPLHYEKNKSLKYEEITDEEIYDGYTIASALNFNTLGLSISISGEEQYGPPKDLSSLGDMDGSLDINTYNSEGKCIKLFVSTKTCPYQSVPTKVICIRPYMTFTNRLGQDIFLKLSREDDPKVLHASDSRLFFPFKETEGHNALQVRLEDSQWSFPVQIAKEDTLLLVLRTENASRKFVQMEIRGFEEGSRFMVVFRVGSTVGRIRLENRISGRKVSIRQSGFGEDYWIQLEPLSATNFSWEDPYGQKFIEAKVDGNSIDVIQRFDLEKTGPCLMGEGMKLDITEMGDIKVVRFMDEKTSSLRLNEEGRSLEDVGSSVNAYGHVNVQNNATPMELIVELGVVGVSLIDHKPKELLYLCLERVFLSYSTGYDGGSTSRFKLILGHLQLDNQLPLTIMPVLLVPEQVSDSHHPVFKMTITACNENPEGVQVYPYVYVRVTEKSWRLDIHEPIIWSLVDFYSNIRLDRLPQSSSVTQVDPEIRVNLIDISEIRLKLSLETAPAQRPHGVLGIWSPILSAVGNAFKIQVHLRRVMHKDRFMRKSSILSAIINRIWRDLIHNPLHLLFSVDVLGMASSTLASISKGFAELSTDGQFMQLRSKQVRSRRITGVGDGIIQGTEALAQGVAFAVSGVVRKPMENARESGLPGIAHGVGRAFVGFVVQPLSGALDLVSMTVEGIGASFSKCLEVLNDKTYFQRIRNPRAIRADNILRNYCEREALGQMILYLGETSRHFGCTEIFKEPSKFAWSDYYEEHFLVPYQRIALVTNKRVMLLQCLDPEKMDKKPCKILWDVPWEDLMALELAKAGSSQPSHLILHLKNFKRAENFVRVIKCSVDEEAEDTAPQAVRICSVVQKMWKAYLSDQKCLILKVPSSQRYVHFSWDEADGKGSCAMKKAIFRSQDLSSSSSASDDRKFVKHSVNFVKIWSSEPEIKGRCTLCRKQVMDDNDLCSIWRPICPDGYIFIGDVARIGSHPPNCAAVYRNNAALFALPIGYDLVWRNCLDDYITPVSVWLPRAPEGFVSLGCVAVASFDEPEPGLVYCVAESLAEETEFEEQKIWSAPSPYPWACHIYQIKSDALHFMALRQLKEESDWKPMRVLDQPLS